MDEQYKLVVAWGAKNINTKSKKKDYLGMDHIGRNFRVG